MHGHDKLLLSLLVPEHTPEVWAGRSECPFSVFGEAFIWVMALFDRGQWRMAAVVVVDVVAGVVQ